MRLTSKENVIERSKMTKEERKEERDDANRETRRQIKKNIDLLKGDVIDITTKQERRLQNVPKPKPATTSGPITRSQTKKSNTTIGEPVISSQKNKEKVRFSDVGKKVIKSNRDKNVKVIEAKETANQLRQRNAGITANIDDIINDAVNKGNKRSESVKKNSSVSSSQTKRNEINSV